MAQHLKYIKQYFVQKFHRVAAKQELDQSEVDLPPQPDRKGIVKTTDLIDFIFVAGKEGKGVIHSAAWD